MAFDWKALGERLDPRKLNWSWAKPARDWVVANRTIVLSTSVALLAGLWGGAVLGRVSAGAPAFEFAQLGSVGAGGNARNANAPRAGVPGPSAVSTGRDSPAATSWLRWMWPPLPGSFWFHFAMKLATMPWR